MRLGYSSLFSTARPTPRPGQPSCQRISPLSEKCNLHASQQDSDRRYCRGHHTTTKWKSSGFHQRYKQTPRMCSDCQTPQVVCSKGTGPSPPSTGLLSTLESVSAQSVPVDLQRLAFGILPSWAVDFLGYESWRKPVNRKPGYTHFFEIS